MAAEYRRKVTVAVLGIYGSGVGKVASSFVAGGERCARNMSEEVLEKAVVIDGKEFVVSIVPMSGVELFSSFRTLTINQANGVVLVYSVTSLESFECLSSMMSEIQSVKRNIVVVGNLEGSQFGREVSETQIEEVKQKWKCPCFEVYPDDQESLTKAFSSLIVTDDKVCEKAKDLFKNGKDQDAFDAFDMLHRAADFGDEEALLLLGAIYERGILFVKKDENRAEQLYKKARELGCYKANVFLGELYISVGGSRDNEKRAFNLFYEAAAMGIPEAKIDLSCCYNDGYGIPAKNESRAYELLRESGLDKKEIFGEKSRASSNASLPVEKIIPRLIPEVCNTEDQEWLKTVNPTPGIWSDPFVELVVGKVEANDDMFMQQSSEWLKEQEGKKVIKGDDVYFGKPGTHLPVRKEITMTLNVSIPSRKRKFKRARIVQCDTHQYSITACPREFTEHCSEIKLTLVMKCTTRADITVPFVFCGTGNDPVHYVYYLKSHVQTSPSNFIDVTELTLYKYIGSGTFGTVYSGKYRGQDVACKVLKGEPGNDENDFRNEVMHLSLLKHPYIVQFFGCSTSNPRVIVTSFCQYGSLDSSIHSNPSRWTQQMRIMALRDTASAMYFMHENGFMHRDLKPGNVLVSSIDFVSKTVVCKLSDFGTVVSFDPSLSSRLPLSYEGTPEFMAPEVLDVQGGQGYYTEKADVYSFGVMMASVANNCEYIFPMMFARDETKLKQFKRNRGLKPQVSDSQVKLYLSKGKRVTEMFIELMNSCWNEPSRRPDFSEIVDKLEDMLRLPEEEL